MDQGEVLLSAEKQQQLAYQMRYICMDTERHAISGLIEDGTIRKTCSIPYTKLSGYIQHWPSASVVRRHKQSDEELPLQKMTLGLDSNFELKLLEELSWWGEDLPTPPC
ncbi:MAG: hypothetical protein ACJ70S_08140 [Nitrososphaera sp.]